MSFLNDVVSNKIKQLDILNRLRAKIKHYNTKTCKIIVFDGFFNFGRVRDYLYCLTEIQSAIYEVQ